MDSNKIGTAYLLASYDDGVLISEDFNIRVAITRPFIPDEKFYIGEVYMDNFGRPFINVTKEVNPTFSYENFVQVLMHLKSTDVIQKVELENNETIWVNFRDIELPSAECTGVFYCTLEYKDGIWYFVPKGCDMC